MLRTKREGGAAMNELPDRLDRAANHPFLNFASLSIADARAAAAELRTLRQFRTDAVAKASEIQTAATKAETRDE